MISPTKLRHALREQETTGRPLGEILIERGDVRAVDLQRAMSAQRAQLETRDPKVGHSRRDMLFGEIAVAGGWIRAQDLHGALREKADHTRDPRKLGEVLRDGGYIDDASLREILRAQDRRQVKKVLTCRECGTAHDGTSAVAGGKFRCKGCRRVFEAPKALFAAAMVKPRRPNSGSVPAKRFLGPYEIVDEVARGGMGIVYRAVHRTLNREVALKVLTAGPGVSKDMVIRFKAESRAAARLHHRAIVPIFDVGVQGDRHYIAMEYIAGRTLDGWVRHRRPDAATVAQVLAEVADALAHAHSRGIIHRDVKPGNILIDAQDKPHITDFGLAMDVKADTRLTQSGVALGTPTYMSPEQARGDMENLDGRSDIFSLGSVCYEAIAGRPPFVGASVMDTLLRVVQDDPRRLRSRAPNVPPDLEAVCMKALEKEPAQRYDNAAAFASDLARVAKGEPVSARQPALWRRVRRRAKKHRAALIAGAGVMSGAAVVGVAWLVALFA